VIFVGEQGQHNDKIPTAKNLMINDADQFVIKL